MNLAENFGGYEAKEVIIFVFVRKFKEPFYRLVESSEGVNLLKIDFLQNLPNELEFSELA